ncbi:hypothetical protein NQD34_015465 [Periophthalmus magnuspinnatus]|nr:hypothetical protein NQD34_015465 [Periophthalmus magnuspinnatus]
MLLALLSLLLILDFRLSVTTDRTEDTALFPVGTAISVLAWMGFPCSQTHRLNQICSPSTGWRSSLKWEDDTEDSDSIKNSPEVDEKASNQAKKYGRSKIIPGSTKNIITSIFTLFACFK